MIGTVITVAATTWLLFSERSSNRWRFVAKPLASAGFILVPLLEGFDTGARGLWILAGLVLGMVGDVALMSSSTTPFLVGLGSFLVGHVAYVVGFTRGGINSTPAFAATAVMLVVSGVVLRWLRPHLRGAFSIAVPAYVVVIALMVITAAGAVRAQPLVVIGAIAFAVSDLYVARERFVESALPNRLLGLPLYYAGQLLIAWSVVGTVG